MAPREPPHRISQILIIGNRHFTQLSTFKNKFLALLRFLFVYMAVEKNTDKLQLLEWKHYL